MGISNHYTLLNINNILPYLCNFLKKLCNILKYLYFTFVYGIKQPHK